MSGELLIKRALLRRLKETEINYIAIPEVLINNSCVADIFVVNNSCIHIYEIKSNKDTDKRLPKQLEVYTKSANKVTLVTHDDFLRKYKKSIEELKENFSFSLWSVSNSMQFSVVEDVNQNRLSKGSYIQYWVSKELNQFFRGVKRGYAHELRAFMARMDSRTLERATLDMLKVKYHDEHHNILSSKFNIGTRKSTND